MKKPEAAFFLPMTQNAIDTIARHLDIDIAKQIFDVLTYRKKHGLTGKTPANIFGDLLDEERNYRFHLARMRAEIGQLFNLCGRSAQIQLTEQLLNSVLVLERLIKPKRVKKEIEESNKYELIHFPGEDGQLKTLGRKRIKTERLNEKLLESEFFDEYILLLRSMVDYFKAALSPFINYALHPIEDKYELPADLGLYAADDLRLYIKRWPAFIKLCETYSKPRNYHWIKRNRNRKQLNHQIIKKLQGEEAYEWIGLEGGKIPSLTDFIKVLADKGIFEPGNRTKQGRAFYKFFHITDKTDSSFLLDDLYGAERKVLYGDCFTQPL